MTDVHHLILTTREAATIDRASRTISALTNLADTLGVDPSPDLAEQSAVLRAITLRLYRDSTGIWLTPDPELTSTA